MVEFSDITFAMRYIAQNDFALARRRGYAEIRSILLRKRPLWTQSDFEACAATYYAELLALDAQALGVCRSCKVTRADHYHDTLIMRNGDLERQRARRRCTILACTEIADRHAQTCNLCAWPYAITKLETRVARAKRVRSRGGTTAPINVERRIRIYRQLAERRMTRHACTTSS